MNHKDSLLLLKQQAFNIWTYVPNSAGMEISSTHHVFFLLLDKGVFFQ
jgi:hypothetical protein